MKIAGRQIRGPNVEVIVIPRSEGDIVFKCQAVLDEDEFDKLCPSPTPPEVIRPGNVKSTDVTDLDYLKMLDEWGKSKTNWMILTSLKVSPDLEWETIKMNDPKTWGNFRQEFKEAGISPAEIARIVATVISANGLDQDKIEEATARFLAGQGRTLNGLSSQDSEQGSTPSGEPVKETESDPQA